MIQIVSLWKSYSRKFDTKAECSKTKWANNDIHSDQFLKFKFFDFTRQIKLIFAEKGNLKFSDAKMRWKEESEKFLLS